MRMQRPAMVKHKDANRHQHKTNALVLLQVRWPIDRREADDPHAKASLLLQAHLARGALPISDYVTDTRSVLDNSLRVLQVPVLSAESCFSTKSSKHS